MSPIDLIRQHKAQQQLKTAIKKPTRSEIGATEIGFDANQGKAVIATEDGGQLYTESITNGYRGPNQPVRVNRDGSVIVSDSMPRIKPVVTTAPTATVYGKLKILFSYKGALWIGADRRTPKRLNIKLNPARVLSFDNLGDGDKYIVSGVDAESEKLVTVTNGKRSISPDGFDFSLSGGVTNPLEAGFFVPPPAKGHGLFIRPSTEIENSIYWNVITSDSVANQDYIYPGISQPSYVVVPPGETFVETELRWRVRLADRGIKSTLIESLSKESRFAPLISRKYIYRSGALTLMGEVSSFDPPPAQLPNYAAIPYFDYPNWINKSLYTIQMQSGYQIPTTIADIQQAALNRNYTIDRTVAVTVSTESPGDYNVFKRSRTIPAKTYKIPAAAVPIAYSYHP